MNFFFWALRILTLLICIGFAIICGAGVTHQNWPQVIVGFLFAMIMWFAFASSFYVLKDKE